MRAVRIILGVVLSLLVLTGCSRGPDKAHLERDIQARLDETFGEGALTLGWLRRSGSAPETDMAGTTGALLYFDAEIKVRPDYELGSWEGPGVGALAYSLGATPEGIKAASATGEEQKARLRVHGSLSYRMEVGQWVAQAPDETAPAARSRLPGGDRGKLREQIADVLSQAEGDAAGEIVASELRSALDVIDRRLARLQAVHGFASGPILGEYWRLGRAYTRFGAGRGVRIANLATAGSVENIQLLKNGNADVALVQSDIALLALEAQGPFKREDPAIELRALASLYPEALHIVVMAETEIQTVSDLAGRRVDLGPFNSGSRYNALAVLDAHDLSIKDLAQTSDQSPLDALDALRRGETDAAFMTIGAPARVLSSFFARNQARLLPLDADVISELAQNNRGVLPFRIAGFSYPRQPTGVPTIASTALMLTTSALPDGEASMLLQWTFEDMDFINLGSLHGARISRTTAQQGLAIPLHDGASAYFNAASGIPTAPNAETPRQ